jgi:hypothetical protein
MGGSVLNGNANGQLEFQPKVPGNTCASEKTLCNIMLYQFVFCLAFLEPGQLLSSFLSVGKSKLEVANFPDKIVIDYLL